MENILSWPVTLLLLFVLALISFFFSTSETAIIGLSKIRLRNMLVKGVRRARNIHNLVKKLDKFIAAILIGNDFVNIAISAIITAFAVQLLGYRMGVIAATLLSSLFVLVLCEITPKILAIKHTEKIALFTAPAMETIINILNPIILFFTKTSNLILKMLGVKPQKRSPLITEEELRLMIEVGKEEGVLSDEERKMLHRIFEFGDTRIEEVMVPKEKIVAVNINVSVAELMDIFVEQGHARLPVFEASVDNIIGIIYARDLLYMLRHKDVFLPQDLLYPVFSVKPGMRINELLRKFQSDKIQLAIVTDKDKKTLGLLTLEDLIEEIVGEID